MERECMDKINRYCQKNDYLLHYVETGRKGPSHDPEFTVVVKIDGIEYGTGTGKNKKEARAAAAKITWEMIENQPQSPSTTQAAELNTSPVTLLPASASDYVSRLNLYSQRTSQKVDYPNRNRTGAAHAPIYSYSCTISGVLYGVGSGNSAAAAKQAAAKQAFEKLEKEGFLTMQNEKSNSDSTFSEHSNSSQVSTQSDSDICFEDSATKLEEKMGVMAICGKPSPFQRRTESSSLKPPRKLAANFGNAKKKEEKKKMSHSDESVPDSDTNTSPYTVNVRFLESFKDIEPIGDGGFGNVFKATAKLDKRTYAVKRVRFTKNVKREVEELARLEHENIVRYSCSWEGDDYVTDPHTGQKSEKIHCLFIQMELCEQGPLDNWIEKNRLDREYRKMAKNIFLQILKGVKYIHSEGLIHRDLKPQNIFLSHEDKIKIGDFGLVTSVAYGTLTRNRGTESYMAPEQYGDEYGKEVDIYALGLIWFEILSTVSRHEKSKVWDDVRKGKLSESFTNRFPTEASIIKKMLSKDASGRYTASEILDFLKPDQKGNSFKTHTQ
ncbi:PREDICTED: interferon-induced, double-stranded RNA-activated protein kinase isoform X2 [Calidris pugnax]|uniref:interferon-induced, double-stranded RNA-activated protein kinase isoform X2 n=1 Tax=Calidris pugnax TaxID=198806 RepID=UPI00071DFBE7|nr:PREDICTED: interferon-induced, double-stranded RNA-activated protein kinase isoform X2 [Calidris pugnax]